MNCIAHPNFCGDKTAKNEIGWACGVCVRGDGSYRVLVGKPEGKRPLGRPRRRWVDNIRMGIQEVGCGYVKVVTDISQIFFLCGGKLFNPSLWSGFEYRLLSRTATPYIMASFNVSLHVFSGVPG